MTLYDTYKYIIYDLCDPRAFQYTYLASPWPASIILFAYIYFIKVCGPRFMKDRQPYNIDWLMHLYNLSQLYWNTYLFSYIYDIYKAAQEYKDFSFWCMPVTYSDDNPVSKVVFVAISQYGYNKVFDLCETVFFTLRKKNNQISFIHVYHHINMILTTWIACRYGSGGNTISGGLINSFVHILMYLYYEMALLGLDKWLWWKKYLTQIQIIQFILVLIHSFSVFFQPSCYYNTFVTGLAVYQTAGFLYLFLHWYIKAYRLEKKKK
ncbi:hypothetical protein R5R35_010371 [Gryllus longicercus]|uniref:Elongation of very long chain fatty acids protein n=1 Tax=Gryllus longicercus TaxID=2509291 RepID=A0AAN9ZF26_9ORTH